MSDTYSIACTQCKKHLWIAQGRGYDKITELRIYSADRHRAALQAFLTEHYRHPLVFDENCEHLPEDFTEVGDPFEIPGGPSAAEQQQAVATHCLVTGNPCGTDTWMFGTACQCESCQRFTQG